MDRDEEPLSARPALETESLRFLHVTVGSLLASYGWYILFSCILLYIVIQRLSLRLRALRQRQLDQAETVLGEHCQVNVRSGRCASGVCKNGGTCVNLLIGGFHCVCPPGEYEHPYCEVSTRSFPPQSFVTFRGLRQRFHFTVSLAFATQDRNALLLYNGRFNEKHDFIALEIVEEQLQLTFSAGETTTTVTPQVPGGVSDGRWHSVLVQYYNKNEKLNRNETRMDGNRSLRLAKALRNATQGNSTLFGNDVRTAYQLLARILQHESRQQGFDLAATREANFHEDVVHTGSALLAPATEASWEQIQRSEAGAAQLLRHFEAYFSNVARNVKRTYLRPFVIVTANMSMD